MTPRMIAAAAALTIGSGMPMELTGQSEMSAGDAMSSAVAYEVILENLTPSQPFSPGVLVTHARSVSLWRVGERSSGALREIAENGNPAPAVAALSAMTGVGEVVRIEAPTHRMGGPGSSTQTLRITATPETPLLSLAVMLICTNDGFTGVDALGLQGLAMSDGMADAPEMMGEGETMEEDKVTAEEMMMEGEGMASHGVISLELPAYDAGTEANDESYGSLVEPCGAAGPVMMEGDGMNDRTSTRGRIAMHEGIEGSGDLDSSQHGWSGPVARIQIRRLDR